MNIAVSVRSVVLFTRTVATMFSGLHEPCLQMFIRVDAGICCCCFLNAPWSGSHEHCDCMEVSARVCVCACESECVCVVHVRVCVCVCVLCM